MKKTTCYVKTEIMGHDLTAHLWICPTLTASECCVFE
ncbi:LuxR family transcriptional regulator, partial [Escherichia coli]|nr:LuxR family transcriptional regulator [Escherichia coli]EEY4101418.1 LuxR family transcriptional regulator [Escherichia coli]EFA4465422.1 LuxR family transcriptional regulator [Escherichia coli]EFB2483946.1 LuxR family transcriptional regulator [Escherichia coli]EFC0397918.1 LuxR family transcriptional regulator [Escherichia coli]